MTTDAGATPRKGWYHGWNIVAACVVSMIAARGLPVSTFTLFVQDWSKELGTPISTLQLLMAPMALACAVLAPIVGSLADKYPARWLYAAGLLGTAALLLGVSVATATWQLVALYAVVLPITITLSATVVGNPLIARWFVRRIGLALGLAGFGMGLAGVVLPPIIGAVMPLLGWRTVWQWGALLTALVVAPIVVLTMRNRPTERDGLHYIKVEGAQQRNQGHGGKDGGGLRFRDIIKRRNFLLLLAVVVPVLAVHGGNTQNLAPIALSRGFTQQSVGILLSVMNLATIIATLALGLVSDRFGNRVPLVALGVMAAAGTAIIGVSDSFLVLCFGVALVGAAAGIWTLVAAAIAAEFGAASVGKGFGVVISFTPLAALAPFAIAKVHENTGSYATSLLVAAVVALIGTAVVSLMRERRGEQPGPA